MSHDKIRAAARQRMAKTGERFTDEGRVNAFLGAVVGADVGTLTGDGVHREREACAANMAYGQEMAAAGGGSPLCLGHVRG
jgi:hypothetical protein